MDQLPGQFTLLQRVAQGRQLTVGQHVEPEPLTAQVRQRRKGELAPGAHIADALLQLVTNIGLLAEFRLVLKNHMNNVVHSHQVAMLAKITHLASLFRAAFQPRFRFAGFGRLHLHIHRLVGHWDQVQTTQGLQRPENAVFFPTGPVQGDLL